MKSDRSRWQPRCPRPDNLGRQLLARAVIVLPVGGVADLGVDPPSLRYRERLTVSVQWRNLSEGEVAMAVWAEFEEKEFETLANGPFR